MMTNLFGRPRSGTTNVGVPFAPTVIAFGFSSTMSCITSSCQTSDARSATVRAPGAAGRGVAFTPPSRTRGRQSSQRLFFHRAHHVRDERTLLERSALELFVRALEEVEQLRRAHPAVQVERVEVEALLLWSLLLLVLR